ncbi:MAG: hypothetical protein ACI4NN_07315 [Pyramidobacter sp.]
MRWRVDKGIIGAALSVREHEALYAELKWSGGAYSMVNSRVLPLPPGLVSGDHIVDGGGLGRYLRRELGFCWGKLPLALGVPSSDFVFRTFRLATDDIQEAREALRWCFADFFPFQYESALFDIMEMPVKLKGRQTLFAGAACAKAPLMQVLLSLKSLRCRVAAAEPQITACIRAVTGEYEEDPFLLLIGIGGLVHLAFIQKSALWMFRTVSLELSRKETVCGLLNAEISKTLIYLEEHFKMSSPAVCFAGNLAPEMAQLPACTGLARKEICSSRQINCVPPGQPDWYDVAGLLMRHIHEN